MATAGTPRELSRERNMTEKGLNYKVQVSRQNFKRTCSAWQRQSVILESTLTVADLPRWHQACDVLNRRFEEVQQAYDELLALSPESQMFDVDKIFDNIVIEHKTLLRSVTSRSENALHSVHDDISPNDSASNCGSNATSSSTRYARAKERAKIALTGYWWHKRDKC